MHSQTDFATADGAVGSPEHAMAAAAELSAALTEASNCIADVDRLSPFLINVVSHCDLWMFVSSRGGLTAGRRDANGALFPYRTEDQLHRVGGQTGPVTLMRVTRGRGAGELWEPFASDPSGEGVTRKLFKSQLGDQLIFQETHTGLGLTFRYTWRSSDATGFVRLAELVNDDPGEMAVVEVLDGLVDVMPAGVEADLMNRASCLANAYRHTELDGQTGLAFYGMSSLITDRAEPAEALRANVAWHVGLPRGEVLLDGEAVRAFRAGGKLPRAALVTGRPGAYLLHGRVELGPGASERWYIAADADRSQAQAARLQTQLIEGKWTAKAIEQAVATGSEALCGMIARADGLQSTSDQAFDGHHLANVMFNIMRGGIFAGERIPVADLRRFVAERDQVTSQKHDAWLAALGEQVTVEHFGELIKEGEDANLMRLGYEYLPLTFGRRHGDPSRPWNQFEIRLRDQTGRQTLNYQGNWRDIFQNWEALAISFPAYLPSFIAKFVNGMTMDGYNPYRFSREGIDWEVPDPDDPWGHIGYWGDHQIVYLLRLLEACADRFPQRLGQMLEQRAFAFADVPYRIKDYEAICADARNTIVFDKAHHQAVAARAAKRGHDGRLVHDDAGRIVHRTLGEKLLIAACAKLSNMVPEGGIWLNTQRPEWNDANNALVGFGLSMVTWNHLRRYVAFCRQLFAQGQGELALSESVIEWIQAIIKTLVAYQPLLGGEGLDNQSRREVTDKLGRAGAAYRQRVYASGLGDQRALARSSVDALLETALVWLDEGLRRNKRADGLHHAYRRLSLRGGPVAEARVEDLDEMLEGQVAALSSGLLSSEEALGLIDRLYESGMYRVDQDSFMLYPNRRLPGFLQRNQVAISRAEGIPLLAVMLKQGDTALLEVDARGTARFHSDLSNGAKLAATLNELEKDEKWQGLVRLSRDAILKLYEQTFGHDRFTGRSGGMYGYEGLGCIYWHMVAKLLLSVQECFYAAMDRGEPMEICRRLGEAYYRVRGGLGFNKTAQRYGAFPSDPYSHTPMHAGASQPGMTGQVKEEVLTRFGELGVRVREGRLGFSPVLLKRREFGDEPSHWDWVDLSGRRQQMDLPANAIGFTYCQVPVMYHLTDARQQVEVQTVSERRRMGGMVLGEAMSASVFARANELRRIDVWVDQRRLVTGE